MRRVRPSAQAQFCHHQTYGLVSALDVGPTALVQTGPLPQGLFMTPQISEMIPHSSTFWLVAPDFTTQNMRNALPSPYPWIRARYLLSSDKVLGAGDTQIYEANLVGGASAWEVRRHRPVIAINPQTALPVAGVQRCILVQLDPLNYHSEANEADNVLDTKFCYTREM